MHLRSTYLLHDCTPAPQRPILEAINGTYRLCAPIQHLANRLTSIRQPDRTFESMSV